MKINRGLLAGLVVGVSVFAVSSCAYDPYYSGTAYSGSYGHGYGYGSSGFSTSIFVSTGNPRWGYDPYAGCYYDYTRRSYYDPYLYGYYPLGYRPHYVYGAPHPGGWTYGSSYCPPPSTIRSYTLTNYSNRVESYRSLNKAWSSKVRVSPTDNSREGYGGRETRQHGYHGSRESTFSQRQESPPSRDGLFQRGGDERDVRSSDRGSFDRGAAGSRSHTQVTAPEPTVRTGNDGRRGGSPDGRFSGRQAPPQIERPAPQQRFERPEPPQRIERPAPPEQPQAQPESPQSDQNPRGNFESRGRGRDIRSLGED